jgi:hypothetical protein
LQTLKNQHLKTMDSVPKVAVTEEVFQTITNISTNDGNDLFPTGYAKLASLMGKFPECAIFRKFGLLNAINLLRLQAELHDMEQQLKEVIDDDLQSGDPIRELYALDFRLMKDNMEQGHSIQYELLLDIGKKLDEYSMFPRKFQTLRG